MGGLLREGTLSTYPIGPRASVPRPSVGSATLERPHDRLVGGALEGGHESLEGELAQLAEAVLEPVALGVGVLLRAERREHLRAEQLGELVGERVHVAA